MLPSGGAITLVFQPITWSPEKRSSAPLQLEAQVVRRMPRRVQRGDGPAVAGQPVAVGEPHVGHEILIDVLAARRAGALGAGLATARRPKPAVLAPVAATSAARPSTWSRWVWVIEDMAEPAPADGREDRLKMRGVGGAGVDQGDSAPLPTM